MSNPFPPYEPSQFAALSPEEIVTKYHRRVLILRAYYIGTVLLALVLFFIFSAMLSAVKGAILYLVILLVLFIAFIRACSKACERRMAKEFMQLILVLDQDCDPDKYLKVIDVLATYDARGRSTSALNLERAYAAYYNGQPEKALALARSVNFKQAKDGRWVRLCTLEAGCQNELGDAAACNATLEKIANQRSQFPDKESQITINNYLRYAAVCFSDPRDWTPEQADLMRSRMLTEPRYAGRVTAGLLLAQYDYFHNNAAEAEQIIQEVKAGPTMPLFQMRLDALTELGEHHNAQLSGKVESNQ